MLALADRSPAAPSTLGPPRGGTALVVALASLLATVAAGLAAGFFYAYAVSVTRGLAVVDDRTYVSTMQAVNATVRTPWFAFGFFGTVPLGVAALAARGRRGWRSPSGALLAAGVAVFFAGVLVVTAAGNLPLNDELASYTDLDAADLAAVRREYEGPWNALNLVRALASTATFACFAAAASWSRPGGHQRA